jgi:DNA polymerase-1
MTETLYLIDGSGFIFRAYHSLPPLTRGDGTPVGAVYGFTNMLLKLTNDLGAERIAVIFDAARKTFRNDIYPEYKAHRPPPPDDLIPQFAIVREATEAMGLPAIDLLGYEADDVIATFTRQAREENIEVAIVSSDKDLMQLVRPGVRMYDPIRSRFTAEAEVVEKFGVPPEKLQDLLALTGDSVDNVPGVPGIGPKTAAELLNEYGNLEQVLQNAPDIKQKMRRERLIEYAESARLSYKLVGLEDNVPLGIQISDLRITRGEDEKLLSFVKHQGFKSLITKLGATKPGGAKSEGNAHQNNGQAIDKTAPSPKSPPKSSDHANTVMLTSTSEIKKTLPNIMALAQKYGKVGVAAILEANHQIRELAICIADNCYVFGGCEFRESSAVGAPKQQDFLSVLDGDAARKTNVLGAEITDFLREIFINPGILKIGYNLKPLLLAMNSGENFERFCGLDDLQSIIYTLECGKGRYSLNDLLEAYGAQSAGVVTDKNGAITDSQSLRNVALLLIHLHDILTQRLLDEKTATPYYTIERMMPIVVAEMERAGIRLDSVFLANLSNEFAGRLKILEEDIFALAGQSFNVGSPKQLGEILFDSLGFKGGKKGKSGAYETGAEILEELAAQGHTIATKVLEWRQISKLKSTYTDSLPNQVNAQTRRIHTSFQLAATSTGRLSSVNPNLQNIPIRTEEGKKIRKAFIPADGCLLLSLDYSQIELRLLAHVADMPSLRNAFKNGDDIHKITASEMFGVPLGDVDGELRRRAKTINFGIIYGISAFGLANRLGISKGEAKHFIDAYFEKYPGIKEYMDKTIGFCRQHGYVETVFGRRCFINGIVDKNPALRNFSERAAINAPLQGSAADIIKRAMIAVHHALPSAIVGAKMLLQVHDELLFEIPETQIEEAVRLIKPLMEKAASLSVPLVVESGYGNNWGEAH